MSRIGKSIETESRLVVARGWGRGRWGVTSNGYRVSFGGDENFLELGGELEMIATQPFECTKCH